METIRREWDTHNDISSHTAYYELIWDSWYQKFQRDRTDPRVQLLRNFIENKPIIGDNWTKQLNDRTLERKIDDSYERKELHKLCDQIGLHHVSKLRPPRKGKVRKSVYIYKPEKWLWEYTVRNPYSKSDEYYKQRDIEIAKKVEKRKQYLMSKYCCRCDANGYDNELMCSISLSGLYCNDCVESIESIEMDDYKFEPANY